MKKFIVLFFFSLTLVACNLADQRVASLRSLTEQVERRGDRFTTEEWKDVYLEYAQLEADFNDLTLSEAQADTVYYLKKRFKKACMHSGIKAIDNTVEDAATSIWDEASDLLHD